MPSTTTVPRRPLRRLALAVPAALVAWAIVFAPVALQTAHDHGLLPCGHDCGTTHCRTAVVSAVDDPARDHGAPERLHVCTACYLLGAAKADRAAAAPLPSTSPRVFSFREELAEIRCSRALDAPLPRGPPPHPDRAG